MAMAHGTELAIVQLDHSGIDPAGAFQDRWRAAAPVTALAVASGPKLLLTGTGEARSRSVESEPRSKVPGQGPGAPPLARPDARVMLGLCVCSRVIF